LVNPYAILAVVAVAILALSEILVSIQRAKMKKQFLDELKQLDEDDSKKNRS